MIPYEDRFDLDRDWGWTQGGRHFRRDSDLFRVLRRLAGLLADRGISYAVMGGMALFEHGYERFTDDIDLLVTPEGLRAIHDRPEALGCMRPDPERKSIRDLETGVRVDFLVAGTFPGDGKPKPVAFPDPAQVGVDRDGVIYLCLPSLIELKLASGMTAGMSRLQGFRRHHRVDEDPQAARRLRRAIAPFRSRPLRRVLGRTPEAGPRTMIRPPLTSLLSCRCGSTRRSWGRRCG